MIFRYGTNHLWVNDLGATIERWQIGAKNVMFPQQFIYIGGVLKLRGGCHICAPFFGKAPKKGVWRNQPQHGVMREILFEPTYNYLLDRHVPDLESGAYKCDYSHSLADVRCKVSVDIFEFEIRYRMEMMNRSRHVTLPISPGIHPYFSFPQQKGTLRVNGKEIALLPPMLVARVIEASKNVELIISGLGTVKMSLEGAYATEKSRIVLWSDDSHYFCVEPVITDPKKLGTDEGFYLGPGEEASMTCVMEYYPE